uniref:Replication protein A 28 kDa subunit n=1 Tax=Crithidia fasciculata TaxID=5656 RepID=RFA2_CRIFA|nr:RecName: Full=Replication protein A 28 kDa subunit; Short=RP-A p28; AltName: Full=Replication factor A protein 2; Short=RF-A protein 2 [Crithidia fasciculata]CAA80683.1 28 kilodalton subunit of replication protein A [Crithidia fasciculata]
MLASQAGSNFSAAASSNGGQQQQQRRQHPIRPLTIKQMLEAQSVGGGVMVVDGREVTQATVVGRVVGYENANMASGGGAITAKHFGYRITDNTGMIVVRQWIDADRAQEPIPLNTHVRASGTVNVWQQSPIVTGTVVSMADSNEMNYHMLDAILTHLRLTQGNKRAAGNIGSGASVQNSAAAVGVQNMLPGGDNKVLLTDLLVSFIKQNGHGDAGMSMDELTMAAQRYSFTPGDVRTAMRTLAAEGKVYQTHDNRFNI